MCLHGRIKREIASLPVSPDDVVFRPFGVRSVRPPPPTRDVGLVDSRATIIESRPLREEQTTPGSAGHRPGRVENVTATSAAAAKGRFGSVAFYSRRIVTRAPHV